MLRPEHRKAMLSMLRRALDPHDAALKMLNHELEPHGVSVRHDEQGWRVNEPTSVRDILAYAKKAQWPSRAIAIIEALENVEAQ